MATWAKGVDFKNSANTARVGGVGIYGTDGSGSTEPRLPMPDEIISMMTTEG